MPHFQGKVMKTSLLNKINACFKCFLFNYGNIRIYIPHLQLIWPISIFYLIPPLPSGFSEPKFVSKYYICILVKIFISDYFIPFLSPLLFLTLNVFPSSGPPCSLLRLKLGSNFNPSSFPFEYETQDPV